MSLLDLLNQLPAPASRGVVSQRHTAVLRRDTEALAPVRIDDLPAPVRSKAFERLRYVRLVDQVIAERRMTQSDAADYVAINHAQEFSILLQSGRGGASQLTYNNWRNWSQQIAQAADDDQAVRALADDYKRGIQPVRGDERFWKLFNGFFLTLNKLPLSVAYRRAAAKYRAEAPRAVIPTLAQVSYRVRQLPVETVILAREGETALRNTCLDYIRRDWTDIQPGEIVIGDSRTFDARVKVMDEATGKWRAVRPTIAALMDGRSWYFAAYWITAEPVNAMTLIDTLALYCVNTNGVPPAIAYFDNGKDYCAKGFATPLEVDGVQHSIFAELGIKLVNATPFNGRAKTIERAFRDMMQQFDKMFPDYLGSRPGQRTLTADYMDAHPEELPSLQQFTSIFADWLKTYHDTPKHGNIHQGKSPRELWDARSGRQALSQERLQMAFLRPECVRKVGRGPAVQFGKTFYYSDRLHYGDRILIKSDRLDDSHVMCFRPDGSFIAEACTRERIKAMALDDPAARAAISAGIARQRRQLKEARTMLDTLTGGMHQISPLELFLAAPGADVVARGAIGSVKGAAHTFTRYAPATDVLPQDDTQAQHPAYQFREDEEEAKSAELKQCIAPTKSDADNGVDIAEAHSFITTKKRREDDDEQ